MLHLVALIGEGEDRFPLLLLSIMCLPINVIYPHLIVLLFELLLGLIHGSLYCRIEASDHFICRTAHNLEFSRFSDFEHDHRVETILEAMAHQTITHLAWRFRQWYKNPTLLATIAAPRK